MKNEFVPYELALRMKQLGFDGPCFGYYDGTRNLNYMFEGKPENFSYRKFTPGHFVGWTSAPTFSQAFRWFREKYEIEATTACFYNKRLDIPYEERQYHCHVIRDGVTSKGPRYKTYEEAELECLKKLLEIVESKKEIR